MAEGRDKQQFDNVIGQRDTPYLRWRPVQEGRTTSIYDLNMWGWHEDTNPEWMPRLRRAYDFMVVEGVVVAIFPKKVLELRC